MEKTNSNFRSIFVLACLIAVSVQAAHPLFAQAPTIRWTSQFGSTGDDRGFGAAVDVSGNIYVSGNAGAALPGQISAGGTDAFVRKSDADGNEVWTRQFGTSGTDLAFSIVVDASGVYVAGTVSGALPGQTHTGGFDAFVQKYDANGNVVWTRQFGTGVLDFGQGIAVDTSGNVYVAGTTFGTLPGQTSAGGQDAFVRKYDASGNVVWTRQFGTSGADGVRTVAVDSSGVYATGGTDGTFSGQTTSGGSDAFVRKYNPSGNVLWTRQFGTPGFDEGFQITVNASGVYVSGAVNGALSGQIHAGGSDAYVRKYDASGTEQWTRQFGTISDDSGQGAAVNASGVYVTGATDGTFPGQIGAGSSDGFVRKHDTSGSEVWTRQFGTGDVDNPVGIAVNTPAIYVTGETLGTFPGQTSAGSRDAFVVKLVEPPDHFLSYDIKHETEVFLEDQFGDRIFELGKAEELLNPADKNGEGIGDPATRLIAYKVKGPDFEEIQGVLVENQFGLILVEHCLDATGQTAQVRPDASVPLPTKADMRFP